MNANVELGLRDWLDSSLEDGHPAVHTGLTGEEIPPEHPIVTVYVDRSQRAAGPLYRAFAKVIVSTPPHQGDDSGEAVESHRETCEAVRAILQAPDAADPESAFNSASGLHWKGGFLQGENEGVSDGRWITTFDFLVGLSTAG